MEEGETSEQVRFREGELIRDSEWVGDNQEGWVLPNEQTGYSVSVKPDALEVNEPLVKVREERGDELTFGSRAQAEAFADQLSAMDGELRVQRAAPNDQADVDAYLLADHNPSITEPSSINGNTMTFDVGANLYGTLGEALITAGPKPYAIEHFVKQDLADISFKDGLRVRVTDSKSVSFGDRLEGNTQWYPDCRVEARDGWRDPPVEEYWCEIKTGEASFERTQVAAMRELAKEARVLKVRVIIDDLPGQYSVRIHEVESNGSHH